LFAAGVRSAGLRLANCRSLSLFLFLVSPSMRAAISRFTWNEVDWMSGGLPGHLKVPGCPACVAAGRDNWRKEMGVSSADGAAGSGVPAGYHTVTPWVIARGAARAIEFM
jgi:hypothetical protein